MKIELSYYIVDNSDILSVSDEATLQEFLSWQESLKGLEYIYLPWGDYVADLEGWLIEEEDFVSQEQVFTKLSLNLQNLIYRLKQLQLIKEPESCASLVFKA